MYDGDVTPNHLSESDILERLVPYLATFDEPKHSLANLMGKIDKKNEVNLKEVVTIFESKHADKERSATGWCLLDDDCEICMMDESGLSKFARLKGGIDFSLKKNISPRSLYFVRPRLYKIYTLQWQRVIASGNPQSVRFTHNGKELFSHMYPFMWQDEKLPVMHSYRGVHYSPHEAVNAKFLQDMGIHRCGNNHHLRHGERMNRCVMHSVSHYSQCEHVEEDMLEEHKGIKYIANH